MPHSADPQAVEFGGDAYTHSETIGATGAAAALVATVVAGARWRPQRNEARAPHRQIQAS